MPALPGKMTCKPLTGFSGSLLSRGGAGQMQTSNSLMKAMELAGPLRGIIPPLITPLVERDALDIGGLERLIEHVLEGGVHGLFILGTSGEGPSLSYRLRRDLIDRVCRQVLNRVPILVGITDTAFVESVNLARQAADFGASAVVLAPPYYMPEGQPELREYLEHLLPELPLPLLLYNMPPLTKVPFAIDTVEWAMEQRGIIGMKDSSADMAYFHRVVERLEQRPDWNLLVGAEELLVECVLLGGHGGVSGGANIFPRLYVRAYEAARDGDLARARVGHERIRRLSERLYHVGRHPSTVIKGMKSALSCIGICSDFMAEPFSRFREPERDRIQAAVDELAGIDSF
jgi:dihydrodipicolinate synthase/N-acetylneuraminate lyase